MFTKSPHRDPVSDTARAFSAGSRITAVGTFISAAEEFSRSREMSDTGLFSWPIRRTAFRTLSHPKLEKPLRTLGHPRYRWLVGARALASLGVIVAPRRSKSRLVSLFALSGLLLVKSYRSSYGSDGSDQMSFISAASTAIAETPRLTPQQQDVMSGFVAFQSVLSYFSAGVAKLRSPVWRDGSAIEGIFRTKTYGDEWLYQFVHRHRWARLTLAWSVIVAETIFPIILALPPVARRAQFLVAAGFHVGNARFMGLNRFFWAFLGTYPHVEHNAAFLRQAWQEQSRK
ncbi:hypothetical protein [Corynebacterium auris]|uniref:hypothetical protein n=1 Tax=Corynebacterium auris TaxID=44750 RepID=UPI0025B55CAA|nr:hypothetical protein [Corynebacterium auris]WJY66994.1 hypothetical protein CAURIS_00230 [Corynebacterium auris]